LPSSQLPLVRGVDVQVFVPLHESVVQAVGSLVQVMPVPMHCPTPLHVSPYVHASVSLQEPLVRGADAQVFVPLQDKVTQEFGLLVHVIAVPLHWPRPLQVSL
jgi:hypothetical protein